MPASKQDGRGAPKRHGDATGHQGKALQEEQLAEARAEEDTLTTIRDQEAVSVRDEIVDLTGPLPVVEEVTEEEDASDVELFEELKDSDDPKIKRLVKRFAQIKASEEQRAQGGVIQQSDGKALVRVKDTFEMTFGTPDSTYEFEAGRQYRVPTAVARQMERVNRLWH